MTSLNRPAQDLIEWLELPFINKAQVAKDAGIQKSNLSSAMKGKRSLTGAQVGNLEALRRKYTTELQRAGAFKNKFSK